MTKNELKKELKQVFKLSEGEHNRLIIEYSEGIDDYYFIDDITEIKNLIELLNELYSEKEQYKALAIDYQKTVRHQAGLLADATKKGYFPPIPKGAKYES